MRPVLGSLGTFAGLAALLLAGCGGGGTTAPEPPNRAPSFTSAAAVSVPENSAGTVYTATATDADSDPLTFSIAGGTDQALFRITAAGALSFAVAPDFEVPVDANRDNRYEVRIGVSDGEASAALDVVVTVTNAGQDAFRVTRVATGLAQPLFLTGLPDGSGRVLVVERAGRLRLLNPATGASTLFLDVSGDTTTDGERGLLGLALAPDHATSGTFYLYLTNRLGDIEVRRYRTAGGVGNPASADVILTIPHREFSNHNGGWIGFGPDNLLYVAVGDGGGAGDPRDNAQNRNVLLGKILRIDTASDSFPGDPARDYAIPAANPFANGGGAPEIWALGLRNPFRASFDGPNLLIGDVGQGAIEEIDLLRPADGGANLGWPFLEGTRPFRGTAPAGLVPPVTEYEHGSGERQGRSVTGGIVYRGPVEALRGQYVFGDFITGNLWSLPLAELVFGQTVPSSRFTLRNAAFAPNAGTIGNIASFGTDQAGNLYIVDIDGEVFRIEPA